MNTIELIILSSVLLEYYLIMNHTLEKTTLYQKKLLKTAVEIKEKKKEKLVLGDINAKIDWGYAGDFVEAFVMILNLKKIRKFYYFNRIEYRT